MTRPRLTRYLAIAALLLLVCAPLAANPAPTAALHASAAVAGTSGAGPYLYWAMTKGAVGRAWLDGFHVNRSFVSDGDPGQELCGVTVAGKYLYWNDALGNVSQPVGRAKLDGTGVTHAILTTDTGPACGVAVARGLIYWASYAAGDIGQASLDGSFVNSHFITGIGIPNVACDGGSCSPYGLAVDSAHIYWGEVGSIGRANLDGTGVDPNFITGLTVASGVAVSSKYIYWTDQGANKQQAAHTRPGEIGRARLDGTGVQRDFITGKGLDGPCGVAVTDRYIFWAEAGLGGTISGTRIGRANLDGTDVRPSFVTGLKGPCGVAVGP